jgi:hypothetical protein
MEPMELPEDVLRLVRAFSRPRMRYYKEYRQSLTELGFKPHEHWYAFRLKLCSSDAECVFASFLLYKEASIALSLFHKSPWPGSYTVYHAALEKLILNHLKLEKEFRKILL